MSLHYLIDGYNVIHKIDALVGKKLEVQREHFLQLIERKNPEGSRKNKVTVIFDGKMDVFSPKRSGEIEVIFSTGETADDRIKKYVCESGHKKSLIVVTDDNEIRRAIRQEGAQICSTNEFLNKIFFDKIQLKKTQQNNPTEENKVISKELETQVNRELENLWLDKDKKREL